MTLTREEAAARTEAAMRARQQHRIDDALTRKKAAENAISTSTIAILDTIAEQISSMTVNMGTEFNNLFDRLSALEAKTTPQPPPLPEPIPSPKIPIYSTPAWLPFAIAIATIVITGLLNFLRSIPTGASPLEIAILGLGFLLTVLTGISALLGQQQMHMRSLQLEKHEHEERMLSLRNPYSVAYIQNRTFNAEAEKMAPTDTRPVDSEHTRSSSL